MTRPAPGQRWMSRSEPKLGLGVIVEVEGAQVVVLFPAAEETRRYALQTAPLVRVLFKEGDEVQDQFAGTFTVAKVEETPERLAHYHCEDGTVLQEVDLLDTLTFSSPEDRFLAGICDDFRLFDFRQRALRWNTRLRQSPARGFLGGRVDLIPHQFAIVAEAADRLFPRLLLADEVGLGKTIEACLILHHLRLTGRASRILILVPEPLVHQWFVELYKRFNLLFALFDEERAAAIESGDPEGNPFLDSQLILASTEFLADSPERAAQARAADFDLLIVDEAHHLEWTPEAASPSYEMVEGLAAVVPSLLLLTATPQQLGPEGHFARLRLLDPDRYTSLEEFAAEARSYEPLAAVVETISEGQLPDSATIAPFLESSPRAQEHFLALQEGEEEARSQLVSELVDSFGTGRVLFRNTRDQLTGFPTRRLKLYPLGKGQKASLWLANLLRELGEDEKVLLITHTPEAAIRIQENLLERIHVESALFHEELSITERDRNAAWFADPEGARILICSEIGSEGRNFQFAHHLVLFDLPQNPEVLEQRIGRLDRIGQTRDIFIHVPYVQETSYELLTRWLAEGLSAFEKPLKGSATLTAELLPELMDFVQDPRPDEFEDFLQRTRLRREEVAEELANGHDRLLALGAPSSDRADDLLEAVDEADGNRRFESFALRLFDQLGLDVDDLAERNYLLKRGQRLSETFADLPEDGLAVTFERSEALFREDLTFLSADHPTFRTALDQFLADDLGNASFAHWKTGRGKGIYLQCGFVLESLAPDRLHLDRFFAPTLIPITVDHREMDRSDEEDIFREAPLRPADPHRLVSQESFRLKILPALLKKARQFATEKSAEPLRIAREKAERKMEARIARLEDLAKRNPQVSPAEIAALKEWQGEILSALDQSRLRLDSLRVVWQT
ncbi:DEAD/DEAH box helicase family protein [Roseibacillus ishigakijimensis]|uniref:DEAD/DEAH box helicase family protein n=2 Tax=Roseibacillus ishigakijimensis TaxID=454146 RepID=A0A934RPU0_9BACT|nr:helicase-related protein [Roseibacillus ishigakijimensis]MBK1834760.1 DEAD/DEAH box helicase family protein [Roseibacillus ishigakijimensis]